jgi:signal transduction histidine kinase
VPAFAGVGLLASLLLFYVTRAQVHARAEAERAEVEARSARADAEAQRNNLHTLFTQAPAAIAILRGSELRYELSNPMNDELMGQRDLVGRTFQEAVPDVAAQGFETLAQSVLETGESVTGYEVGGVVRTPDGALHQKFVNFTYQPLCGADGRPEAVVGFAHDVTEQVLARQKVEALAVDLQKAVRVRDEFVSVAGHELKTPLATLKLQVQNLQHQTEKGTFGAPDAQLIERLVRANRHIDRLERLIEQLLDVTRITSGSMQLHVEPVDLTLLLEEIIERFEEQLSQARCEVCLHSPVPVLGHWDRMRIDQVLTNLISNAAKYGAGKPIEVTVAEAADVARVSVRDHGIGIAPHDRERIFARFERAVSDRRYGGLGLGLWISSQIAQAHGGRILLESSEGDGSTFTVELPRRGAAVVAPIS